MEEYTVSIQDLMTYCVFGKHSVTQQKNITYRELKKYLKEVRKNLKKANCKLYIESNESLIWNLNWYLVGNYVLPNNCPARDKDLFKNKTLTFTGDINKMLAFADKKYTKNLIDCLKGENVCKCAFDNQNIK